jgi:hypothetical protein
LLQKETKESENVEMQSKNNTNPSVQEIVHKQLEDYVSSFLERNLDMGIVGKNKIKTGSKQEPGKITKKPLPETNAKSIRKALEGQIPASMEQEISHRINAIDTTNLEKAIRESFKNNSTNDSAKKDSVIDNIKKDENVQLQIRGIATKVSSAGDDVNKVDIMTRVVGRGYNTKTLAELDKVKNIDSQEKASQDIFVKKFVEYAKNLDIDTAKADTTAHLIRANYPYSITNKEQIDLVCKFICPELTTNTPVDALKNQKDFLMGIEATSLKLLTDYQSSGMRQIANTHSDFAKHVEERQVTINSMMSLPGLDDGKSGSDETSPPTSLSNSSSMSPVEKRIRKLSTEKKRAGFARTPSEKDVKQNINGSPAITVTPTEDDHNPESAPKKEPSERTTRARDGFRGLRTASQKIIVNQLRGSSPKPHKGNSLREGDTSTQDTTPGTPDRLTPPSTRISSREPSPTPAEPEIRPFYNPAFSSPIETLNIPEFQRNRNPEVKRIDLSDVKFNSKDNPFEESKTKPETETTNSDFGNLDDVRLNPNIKPNARFRRPSQSRQNFNIKDFNFDKDPGSEEKTSSPLPQRVMAERKNSDVDKKSPTRDR